MTQDGQQTSNGKWVVLALVVVSLFIALMRWTYVPKTNPRSADPGNPFYSKPAQQEPVAPAPK
jgi:hypothetical protein